MDQFIVLLGTGNNFALRKRAQNPGDSLATKRLVHKAAQPSIFLYNTPSSVKKFYPAGKSLLIKSIASPALKLVRDVLRN